MWRRALTLLSSASTLAACGGRAPVSERPAATAPPGATPDAGALDGFGVRMLYASLPRGMAWSASWRSPPRSFTGRDPHDPWFDADHGDASYRVSGDGTLEISGETPRMYVHDPAVTEQWRDVEITVYFERVADARVPWGGMVSVARTNHGTTGAEEQNPCDSRGLAARIRYDGYIDFEKETRHPDSHALGRAPLWADGMPYGEWLGYKHVVYDVPGGAVRQELWLDRTDGADGGRWERLAVYDDTGTQFGAGAQPCAAGLPPTLPLRREPSRPGSESGKPNVTVYFRSDGVGPGGLVYKWASVREILPRQ